ncbi:chromatin accessibility complex protein 1 [Orussus abietinus]|uniref:chromatin accessibility complex protein 1 n=1 Tax=Orussus abietinus TaxID=222816 RepID=UPI0006262208|nr:chromatin accessibility complex protein 1 [Orussus abietinus]
MAIYARSFSRSEFQIMASQSSPARMRELRLPVSRVKTIMKSSPYVDTVGQDGLFLVAKATELFIHHLAEEAYLQTNKGSSLEYKHLAEIVQTNETLEFLKQIMPRKITVKQFKEMMEAKNAEGSSNSSESSDSDSDSQSDSESSSNSEAQKMENSNSSDGEEEKDANENNKCDFSDKSDSIMENESDDDDKK